MRKTSQPQLIIPPHRDVKIAPNFVVGEYDADNTPVVSIHNAKHNALDWMHDRFSEQDYDQYEELIQNSRLPALSAYDNTAYTHFSCFAARTIIDTCLPLRNPNKVYEYSLMPLLEGSVFTIIIPDYSAIQKSRDSGKQMRPDMILAYTDPGTNGTNDLVCVFYSKADAIKCATALPFLRHEALKTFRMAVERSPLPVTSPSTVSTKIIVGSGAVAIAATLNAALLTCPEASSISKGNRMYH